jgi:hypothetical protein
LAVLQYFQICELGNESGNGIVELPLAFFIKLEHGHGDGRLGHGGDAVDGVLPQRLTAPKRLIAVAPRLHELAMARDHHADSGIMAGIDLRLHCAVETVQALRREANGIRRSCWQRSCDRA